jgi:DNA-3-methyladenine glycosylase
MKYLGRDFFARDTLDVARDLIGTTLIVGRCEGRIVETEAYTTDPASHSVIRRNQACIMRETFGHLYVYFIYGMYYCLNFTTDRQGPGAVLIRAAEPIRGIAEMKRRREQTKIELLASGPGRLCQAFGINTIVSGRPVGREVRLRERSHNPEISSSRRIGISRAAELEWRFYEKGSPFVSKHRLALGK